MVFLCLAVFILSLYPEPPFAAIFVLLRPRPTRLFAPAMAQIRGASGYQLGAQNPFGGPSKVGGDASPLDTIREQTSKIEDVLDTYSEPIKPYVIPALAHSFCSVWALVSAAAALISAPWAHV